MQSDPATDPAPALMGESWGPEIPHIPPSPVRELLRDLIGGLRSDPHDRRGASQSVVDQLCKELGLAPLRVVGW